MSKQFTAAAVLLLADLGRLTLDQPLSHWIPGCPESWAAITLHHLLCHTSGLGHWDDYSDIDLCAWQEPLDLVRHFQRKATLTGPGKQFSYSSPGYVLLAHVVQRAADQTYQQFLEDRLFSALGLCSTFAGAPALEADCAVGLTAGLPVPSFELDSVGMGAGDVWSTVGDLVRWDQALAEGELLSSAALAATFRPQVSCGDDSAGTSYGYGWILGPLAGREARFHTGHNAGFRALNVWVPKESVRFVLLSNDDETDPQVFPEVLRDVLEA